MKKILVTLLVFTGLTATAQVKIGDNPTAPMDPSVLLEMETTNKGVLMPRVALTGATDATTIPTPVTSLFVYNTATAGTAPNDVTPGFYYWDGAKWRGIGSSNDGFIIKRVACAGTKVQTITDVNTPATDGILVSYEDPSGDVISGAVKSRNAGVSFTVEFAAAPPATAYLNYAYPGSTAIIPTGPQGPIGLTGATGATGAAGPTGATGAVGPAGATGATGAQGIQGVAGPTGPQGATGATGATGAAGLDGKTVLNGAANPVAGTGVDGDFYINTTSNTIWGPKAAGAWPGAGVSLVGPQGPAATVGLVTKRVSCAGTKVQTITDPDTPAADAILVTYEDSNGDAINATVKSRSVGASFVVEFASAPPATAFLSYAFAADPAVVLTGPQGPTGAQGPAGATGAQGPAGATGAQGPQGIAGITIKGLVTCAGTMTQTISDANVTAGAAITVTYEDPSGDLIYTSVKSRSAGTNFVVQFAATPPVTASINYTIVP